MKIYIKKVIFALVFIVGIISHVSSSHYMGGNISWTCLGNDSFLIKMTIYRDCNGTRPYDLDLDFTCLSTQAKITTLTLKEPVPVDITPRCKHSCTRCEYSTCPFPYGIEKYIYFGVVFLGDSSHCCNILIEHQGAVRSTTITTGDPNSFFYIDAILNRCIVPCNSSPQFMINPISITCIGQDFNFNPSFVDMDRDSNGKVLDSISYEWTTPLVCSGSPFLYYGQYAYNHPIYYWGFKNGNLPFPRGFHLDPQSGMISFRPMKIEQSVMALKIVEWRKINGIRTKISETKFDFSIIVISCPNNNVPVLSGPYYKEVCANDTVSFSVATNDYDTQDSLAISWDNSISGAIWSDNNGQVRHPTGTLKWKPGEKHASTIPYIFTVTVQDDACPVNGFSTRAYQILVKPLPKARITIADSGCGDYHLFAQSILGSSPFYQWVGKYQPGFYHIGSNFHFNYPGPGVIPFSLQMDAQGCTRIYYDTIKLDTFLLVQLTPDHEICYGDTTTLVVDYELNKGPVKIKWHNGDSNKTVSFIGQKDTIWSLEVSDTTHCVVKRKVAVKVHPLPLVNFYSDPAVPIPDTIGGTYYTVKFYDSSKFANPPANYLWDFGNQTTSIIQHPVALYTDTGKYNVSLVVTDSFGCLSSATKTIYIQETGFEETSNNNQLTIYPNPTDRELYIKTTIPMREIRLINSLGKVVRHEHDLNTREYQLDAFPKGLYVIEITDIDGARMWRKVMFH